MHHPLKAIQFAEAELNEWAQPTNRTTATTKKSLFLSMRVVWFHLVVITIFLYIYVIYRWFFFCAVTLVPWETMQCHRAQSFRPMSVKSDTRRLFFALSLLNIRVFFCVVCAHHPTFNCRLFAFGSKKRHGPTHFHFIRAARIYLAFKKTLSMILCVHDGLQEKCNAHTCVCVIQFLLIEF